MKNAIVTSLNSCWFNICQYQVTDLLGKYPDLMDGFNDLLDRGENIGNC